LAGKLVKAFEDCKLILIHRYTDITQVRITGLYKTSIVTNICWLVKNAHLKTVVHPRTGEHPKTVLLLCILLQVSRVQQYHYFTRHILRSKQS